MWANDKSWLVIKNVIFFNAFVGAIIGGLVIGPFIGSLIELQSVLWAWAITALALFCGIYAVQWPSRNMVKKVFPSSKKEADQIITHTLQKKGMSYSHGKVFELTDTDVRIKIQSFKNRHSHFNNTVVSIGPMTDENSPLIKSLQHKIDMAFQPRGLS